MIFYNGDLGPEHVGHRWMDNVGAVWFYDGNSWNCEGKILAAVIWDMVPASYGPFERL